MNLRRFATAVSVLKCLLGWLPLVAVACHSSAGQRAAAWARDSAGVTLTTVTVPAEDVPDWGLRPTALTIPRPEQAGAPDFVEVADALWLSNGRILVVDRGASAMHVFGGDGALRTTLGRRGQGPGEFRQIGVVTVTGEDSIFAHDPVRRTLQVFHPDAGLVRTVSLVSSADGDARPRALWRSGPSRFVRLSLRSQPLTSVPANGQWTRWGSTVVLALVDEAGDSLAERVEFEGEYSALGQMGDVRLPFSNRPLVFVGAQAMVYGSGQTFELTFADVATFARRMQVRWPSIREPIQTAEIDRLTATRLARSRSQMARTLVSTQFSRRLLPSFRPALGGVLISPDGHIWAGRFEPAIDYPSETLWYVLDAQGTPLGRVPLPPKSHLTAVTGDSLLLVQRDSMDVWSVKLYRLVR